MSEYIEIKQKLFDLLYRHLNREQREAVFTVKGPLLILAGAGSGKTTVLVNRIAYMIKYGNSYFNDNMSEINEGELHTLRNMLGIAKEADEQTLKQIMDNFIEEPVDADRILSITFTNKAAREMKERPEKILGEDASKIWAGTFHSICVRILRRCIDRLGYSNSFTIYDMDDAKKQISEVMKELHIDEKILPARSIMNTISRYKENLIYPEDLTQTEDIREQQINSVYEKYQQKIKKSNALDFDDIISLTVKILSKFDDIRIYYNNKFEYVLIDEYQDTNYAQYLLVSLISEKHRNIMAVGDDDQSIYKFRGATIENILSFHERFKDTKVVKLEQNYRSTKTILNAANSVISCNTSRLGKELWTDNADGSKLILKENSTQNDEAYYVVNEINRLHGAGYTYKSMAVLYRVNAQASGLETAFVKSGVPYRVLGGVRFFERKEIKDIISYLCIINNPGDIIRLRRIINEPRRGIGETTISVIEQLSFSENKSTFEIIESAAKYKSLFRNALKLKHFAQMIRNFQKMSEEIELPDLIERVFDETGYRSMLESGGTEEQDRLDNVKELISSAIVYKQENPDSGLAGFLEEKALVSDIDNYDANSDAVTMMTIHSAKGLEFPVVFIPGLEENIFPSRQSAEAPDQLEEERRLAYVALTRAKEKLYITHARERLLYGKTMPNELSRFVLEIPDEYMEKFPMPFERQRAYSTGFVSKKPSNKVPENSEFSTDYTTASSAKNEKQSLKKFKTGDSVMHTTFGRGLVISVKDMGGDILYEVAFDTAGTKKMMATFAKLVPVGGLKE